MVFWTWFDGFNWIFVVLGKLFLFYFSLLDLKCVINCWIMISSLDGRWSYKVEWSGQGRVRGCGRGWWLLGSRIGRRGGREEGDSCSNNFIHSVLEYLYFPNDNNGEARYHYGVCGARDPEHATSYQVPTAQATVDRRKTFRVSKRSNVTNGFLMGNNILRIWRQKLIYLFTLWRRYKKSFSKNILDLNSQLI